MRNLRSAQLLENLGNEYYLLASLYEESAKYDKALDLYQKPVLPEVQKPTVN